MTAPFIAHRSSGSTRRGDRTRRRTGRRGHGVAHRTEVLIHQASPSLSISSRCLVHLAVGRRRPVRRSRAGRPRLPRNCDPARRSFWPGPARAADGGRRLQMPGHQGQGAVVQGEGQAASSRIRARTPPDRSRDRRSGSTGPHNRRTINRMTNRNKPRRGGAARGVESRGVDGIWAIR